MALNFSSLTLQLRFCHSFSHTAGWQQSRTWADYTVYFLHSGAMRVTYLDQGYTVMAGDVIFSFPGDHGTMLALENVTGIVVCFHADVGNYHHLFFQQNCAGIYRDGIMADAGQALYTAFSGKENALRFTPRDYGAFAVFLAELLSHTGEHIPFHRPAPQYSDWKLNDLISYLDTSAPRVLPIRELAQKMEMSEKYFIQYFRTQTGFTPGQYMNRQRMYVAAEYLGDYNLTLEQISQKLGYADAYSFSKAFRKFYGEPPATFRSHLK